MNPRIGWYTRGNWMATFRPDGVGRIVIESSGQTEIIEFTEIVCDLCNADAGVDHEDGVEGRIYFTGSDSLCESCGLTVPKEG